MYFSSSHPMQLLRHTHGMRTCVCIHFIHIHIYMYINNCVCACACVYVLSVYIGIVKIITTIHPFSRPAWSTLGNVNVNESSNNRTLFIFSELMWRNSTLSFAALLAGCLAVSRGFLPSNRDAKSARWRGSFLVSGKLAFSSHLAPLSLPMFLVL